MDGIQNVNALSTHGSPTAILPLIVKAGIMTGEWNKFQKSRLPIFAHSGMLRLANSLTFAGAVSGLFSCF